MPAFFSHAYVIILLKKHKYYKVFFKQYLLLIRYKHFTQKTENNILTKKGCFINFLL